MKLKIKEYDIAKKREEKYKINSKINALEVRVIDEKGDQRGVMSLKDAIYIANEVGLDLVEIAPNSNRAHPSIIFSNFHCFRMVAELSDKMLVSLERSLICYQTHKVS